MILHGNQRGNAKDLALHLMKAENERVEIHELRGFLSRDLMGAFNEIHAISRGTRCEQFLYSLSLNPPPHAEVSTEQFEAAIQQAEKSLGLENQPRAIVFHEKHGRRHCHVVWSRIDIERMKAVQMSHDREKLTSLSRELFLEHGWEMPAGLQKREERSPLNYTHAEYQQAQRIGKNAGQIKAEIQEAWHMSDNRLSLENALAERGYFLARGDRRGFVVIDMQGEIYSLPKQAGVKTKDVRTRLGDEKELPSVADIQELLAKRQDKQQPVFSKEDALAKISRHHAAFTPAMMERSLKPVIRNESERKQHISDILQSDLVLKIGKRNGHDVYTTKAMLDLENRMIENAKAMAKTASHKTDRHAVQRAIFDLNNTLGNQTNGKASLSDEQKRALAYMARDEQLSLVVGVAGAGKTTIMQGAKDALEAQGYRVRGAAPSGVAAAGLREIGMNASTLHSLEARIKLAQDMMDANTGKPLTQKQHEFIKNSTLSSKDVLIVDEAGMVSAKQLANIIELTKQSGAKLVLVGDPAQLQSVEAGAAFRTLLERNDSVSIGEVRRQETAWQRSATVHLSQCNVKKALIAYDKKGFIEQAKTRGEAKTKLVADVMKSQKKSPDVSRLVLAYTRKDVVDLNAMIKVEMVKYGKVAPTDLAVQVTVKDGDIDRQEIQSFAIGDRICFQENNHDLGVMNGSFGTLKAINNGRFKVALDNGKNVAFLPKEYDRFQLGYACTVHKSQGMTVDETYVLATPHFDRHTSYVAMSRHKKAVKLYANKKDFKNKSRLYNALGKQGENLSTLDFTDKQIEKEQPRFFKRHLYKKKPAPKIERNNSPQKSNWIETLPNQQVKTTTPEPIQQQDIVKLRDEFIQNATNQDNKTQQQQNYNHNRGLEHDI